MRAPFARLALLLVVLLPSAPAAAKPHPLAPLYDRLRPTLAAVDSPRLRDDHSRLLRARSLTAAAFPFERYRTLRVLLEATRDGGFFGARWQVTDREPASAEVWSALAGGRPVVAECDELSAFMTDFACAAGVRDAGLFWPTRNHTIVATAPAPGVFVLWPTTDVFLACGHDVDPPEFDPSVQRRVYGCASTGAPAVRGDEPWLGPLVARFEAYAPAGPDVWELLRLDRQRRAPSSRTDCPGRRRALVAAISAHGPTEAERRALDAYFMVERGQGWVEAFLWRMILADR